MKRYYFLLIFLFLCSCSSYIPKKITTYTNTDTKLFFLDKDSLYTVRFSIDVPSNYVLAENINIEDYLFSYKSDFGILIHTESNYKYRMRDTTYLMNEQDAFEYVSKYCSFDETDSRRYPDLGRKHLFISKKGVEVLYYNIRNNEDVEYLMCLASRSLIVY